MYHLRKLPNVTKPMSFAHRTIAQMGFAAATLDNTVYYRIEVRDALSGNPYTFRFPTELLENGDMVVKLSHGRFDEEKEIPASIQKAVHHTLREVVEYLLNRVPRARSRTAPLTNGHMVANKEDAVRLGNEMKVMKTNAELLEGGIIPDPIQ